MTDRPFATMRAVLSRAERGLPTDRVIVSAEVHNALMAEIAEALDVVDLAAVLLTQLDAAQAELAGFRERAEDGMWPQ